MLTICLENLFGGGYIKVFDANTDVESITYKDFNGTVNASQISIVDGRATIIVNSSKTFDLYVYDAYDHEIIKVNNISSKCDYVATYGVTTLEELNALSTDVLVYMKQDDAVYMNSYRSTTEWRFTQIDGDMLNEATIKADGWTENSYSIGGNYTAGYGLTLNGTEFSVDESVIATVKGASNVILEGSSSWTLNDPITDYTWDELVTLAKQGRLFIHAKFPTLSDNAEATLRVIGPRR